MSQTSDCVTDIRLCHRHPMSVQTSDPSHRHPMSVQTPDVSPDSQIQAPCRDAAGRPKSGFFQKCSRSLRGAPGAPPESPGASGGALGAPKGQKSAFGLQGPKGPTTDANVGPRAPGPEMAPGTQNPDFFEIPPGAFGRLRGPAGGCQGLPGASGSFRGLPGASGADFRVRKSAGKNQIGAESPFLSATCGHINSPGSCGPPGPLDP